MMKLEDPGWSRRASTGVTICRRGSRLTERDGWGSVILSSFQSCEPEAVLRRHVLARKNHIWRQTG